jgi:hypothetical protein
MKMSTDYPSSDEDSDTNSYEDELFAKAKAKRDRRENAKIDFDNDTDTSTHSSSSNVPNHVPEFLSGLKINVQDPITIKEKNNLGAYKMYEIIARTTSGN